MSRKTFRHFEMRQRRDLARFKAEVLDAVAKIVPTLEGRDEIRGILHQFEIAPLDGEQLASAMSVTFGNGETPEKSA